MQWVDQPQGVSPRLLYVFLYQPGANALRLMVLKCPLASPFSQPCCELLRQSGFRRCVSGQLLTIGRGHLDVSEHPLYECPSIEVIRGRGFSSSTSPNHAPELQRQAMASGRNKRYTGGFERLAAVVSGRSTVFLVRKRVGSFLDQQTARVGPAGVHIAALMAVGQEAWAAPEAVVSSAAEFENTSNESHAFAWRPIGI